MAYTIKLRHISASCICLLLFILTGCAQHKTYSYPEIRESYADVICRISPASTGNTGKDRCSPRQVVSLRDAIRIALANNPDGKIAVSRIHQAMAAIRMADSRFYPAIGFSTEYIQGDAPSAYLFKTIDQRELPAGLNFNDPGWFQNFESAIYARINLYNGGRDVLGKQMAEQSLRISQLAHRGIENALGASVIDVYYKGMASRDFIGIVRESIATLENQEKIVTIQFEAGGALKSDLLSLDVRLAQAKEELILHQNRLETALTALANLMGVSPQLGIRLGVVDLDLPTLPQSPSEALVYATEHRPEILLAREQVVRAKMALDLSDAGILPQINMNTRYYVDDAGLEYETHRDNWMAAVMFNWEFFNGFATQADQEKARSFLEKALIEDRKALISLQSDIKNAYQDLEASEARLWVVKKSVASAEETFHLVKQQYEGGSATVTRYLEAELAHNQTKTRTTAAFYDKERAIAQIGRAIGYWGTAAKTFKE